MCARKLAEDGGKHQQRDKYLLKKTLEMQYWINHNPSLGVNWLCCSYKDWAKYNTKGAAKQGKMSSSLRHDDA